MPPRAPGDVDFILEAQRGRREALDVQRRVGSGLAYFLAELLAEDPRWPGHRWIDDLLVEGGSIVNDRELVVRGKIVWGDEQHVGPFLARVRVRPAPFGFERYEIHFNDARRPDGRPYPGETKYDPREPDWQFTFTRGL